MLPHFSELASTERWRELSSTIGRYLRTALVVTVPLGLGLILLARPLTELLLHRGAFSGEDVATVASCLAALAFRSPSTPA